MGEGELPILVGEFSWETTGVGCGVLMEEWVVGAEVG